MRPESHRRSRSPGHRAAKILRVRRAVLVTVGVGEVQQHAKTSSSSSWLAVGCVADLGTSMAAAFNIQECLELTDDNSPEPRRLLSEPRHLRRWSNQCSDRLSVAERG